jgi:hypothetical protein
MNTSKKRKESEWEDRIRNSVFAFILTSEVNFSVIFRRLSLCLVKHVGIKAEGLLVAT